MIPRLKDATTYVLALIMIVAFPNVTRAQSCSFNGVGSCNPSANVSLTPTDVMRLRIGSATTNLGAPVKANFDAGSISAAGPTISVKSNRNYRVTIEPTTQFFCVTSCPGVASTKPAANLQFSTNGTSFTSLAFGSAQTITGTGLGTPSDGNPASPQATLSFLTLLSYAVDKAGTYGIVVKLTLSAP